MTIRRDRLRLYSNPRILAGALYLLPLLFLLFFFFFPLANIFRVSLWQGGRLNLTSLLDRAIMRTFWQAGWFTLWQASLSTFLTLLVGLPLAYVFAHYRFPGKTILRALTTIPFVMPTVVVAAAFTTLLGDTGMINRWLQSMLGVEHPIIQLSHTIWMILLAHIFYNVSIVIRTVGGFWAGLNPNLENAAQVLGANWWNRFRRITLPLLFPSIMAAATLVFLFCFTSFGIILILGGIKFATLEVEIYRQTISLFNLPAAALLSLAQMVITLILTMLYTSLQARGRQQLEHYPAAETAVAPTGVSQWMLLFLLLGAALLLLLGPLLSLVWRSFTLGQNTFTLDYYMALTVNQRQSAFFVPPLTAIRNSLLYAISTVAISLLLGVISAYMLADRRTFRTNLLEPIMLLPLGTSAVTLGFGYIISMGGLRTSVWLVPIAHSLIAIPFVIRSVLPALRAFDPRLRQAAAILGAPPPKVWLEIDLPLLARTMLVSAVFAFTISLGEFGATLLVSRPEIPTMPVIIYRALTQPGEVNYGQALAMSTIMMAVAACGLIAIERFRIAELGEF